MKQPLKKLKPLRLTTTAWICPISTGLKVRPMPRAREDEVAEAEMVVETAEEAADDAEEPAADVFASA